jgi:hypothetical protein
LKGNCGECQRGKAVFSRKMKAHTPGSELLLFVLVLVPFLYVAANVVTSGVPDVVNSGDGALLEMSTRSLFSRGILLGPYSRFLFFHPGPIYFAVRYPLYMLLGQRNSSFLLTTVLISVLSLFAGWYIVRRFTGRLFSVVFASAVALYLLNTDKILWLSEWNPHIIMFPVLLYLLAMAAVSLRKVKYIYTAVISGSFVAQTHIGSIPLLASIAAAAIVFAVFPVIISPEKKRWVKHDWKHLLLGTALLLLLWAPPLYEEFSSDSNGNLTVIREFLENSEPDQDLSTSLAPWSSILSGTEMSRFMRILRARNPEIMETLPIVVIALRLLFLSVGYSLLRRRGKFRFLSALSLICILAHGATLYSVSQIRGELFVYLVEWMNVISILSMFAIITAILAMFNDYGKSVKMKKYVGMVLAAFIVVSSVVVTIDTGGYFNMELDPSWSNEIAVQEISTQLAGYIDRQSDECYLMKLESQECWPVMMGLMNTLEKQGYHICMEDNVYFVSTLPPRGVETKILRLGTLTARGGNNPNLVARSGNVGVIAQ